MVIVISTITSRNKLTLLGNILLILLPVDVFRDWLKDYENQHQQKEKKYDEMEQKLEQEKKELEKQRQEQEKKENLLIEENDKLKQQREAHKKEKEKQKKDAEILLKAKEKLVQQIKIQKEEEGNPKIAENATSSDVAIIEICQGKSVSFLAKAQSDFNGLKDKHNRLKKTEEELKLKIADFPQMMSGASIDNINEIQSKMKEMEDTLDEAKKIADEIATIEKNLEDIRAEANTKVDDLKNHFVQKLDSFLKEFEFGFDTSKDMTDGKFIFIHNMLKRC